MTEKPEQPEVKRRGFITGAAAVGAGYALGNAFPLGDSNNEKPTVSQEKGEVILEKERLLEGAERQVVEWFRSPEGQEAFAVGNLESIFSNVPRVTGKDIEGTRFDPTTIYGRGLTIPLDTRTGEIGKEFNCNSFQLDATAGQTMFSAEHCLDRLGVTHQVANNVVEDIGTFAPIGVMPESLPKLRFNPDLKNSDIAGKLLVGVAYDDVDSYTNYPEEGIKLYAGFAIPIQKTLVDTARQLRLTADADPYSGLGDFILISSVPELLGRVGGQSGSPVFYRDTVCGIHNKVPVLPRAKNSDFRQADNTIDFEDWWGLRRIAGPETLAHHAREHDLLR